MREILDEDLRNADLPVIETRNMQLIRERIADAKRHINRSGRFLYLVALYVVVLGFVYSYFTNYSAELWLMFLLHTGSASLLAFCGLNATKYPIPAFVTGLFSYVLFELFSAAPAPQTLVYGIPWKLGIAIFICVGLYYAIALFLLQRALKDAALEAFK